MSEYVTAFGEVLLRLSPFNRGRLIQTNGLDLHFGGSELNTAIALALLGVPVKFLSSLPKNDLGLKALREMDQYNIDTTGILRSQGRMGLYFLEQASGLRSSKVIYDRAHSVFSHIKATDFDWNELLEGSNWFHWSGIIPALSTELTTVTSSALKAAKSLGLKISCDLNYRKTLWLDKVKPSSIMRDLVKECDVVVGGPDAFKEMLGMDVEKIVGHDLKQTITKKAAIRLCDALIEEFPNVNYVAMTIRDTISPSHVKLTGVLWDGTDSFSSASYDLHNITDRVGSGDSFMAGIIYGLHQGIPKEETIAIATALAAIKHSIQGDINCTSIEEIQGFLKDSNLSILR